jgi:nucleotide-binding universal stress UspA family protein
MQRILVASDSSSGSAAAVRRAARLAGEQNAALHIVHILPYSTTPADLERAREELQRLATRTAQQQPCVRCTTLSIRLGKPAKAILAEAKREVSELIVLGRQATASRAEKLLGSTVERLLRGSHVPVLIVHHEPKGPYRQVLAAVDADHVTDEIALACSVSSAQSIYAVHALHEPSEPRLSGANTGKYSHSEKRRELEEEIRSVLGRHPQLTVRIHAEVREGEVLSVLSQAWKEHDPDLMVVGTHGRSGLSRALHGSVASAILEGLPFDTLVQRGSGH